MYKYDLDPNQEAFALAFSNILGGLWKGYPCCGSFSRSAINAANGAKSPISNLFMGFFVLVCLLLLAPLFRAIPLPALGEED